MRRILAVLLLAMLLTSGCSEDHTATTIRPHWHPVTLPMPPGPPGRIALRAATVCGAHWYVVGAILGTGGASRPAAWTSEDARTWHSLPLDPAQFYARKAILYAVACRGDEIAALGAKSGGAHGNPRVTSWYRRPDGTLVDVNAPFNLYGGAAALSVSTIAAGPDGWMIAGSRTSGAAVWTSADATRFLLRDHDPALSGDTRQSTSALDLVHDGSGWTVVGTSQRQGAAAPAPLAWTSADGVTWTRQPVPAGTGGFADLERVVRLGDDLVAAGLRGRGFGLWDRHDGRWRAGQAFGRLDARVRAAPYVSGLAVTGTTVLAAVSDGRRLGLWARRHGDWSQVSVPVRPATSGDAQLTVAARGGTVLLLGDDGRAGQLWRTRFGR